MAYIFPEQRFAPGRRFSGEYYARVQRGYEVAASSSVAICGLARDIEPVVPKLTEVLAALCNLFLNARVYLYENDSVDATRLRLQALAASDARITLKSEYRQRPKWGPVRSTVRADQMAEYRNVYHQAVAAGEVSGLRDRPGYGLARLVAGRHCVDPRRGPLGHDGVERHQGYSQQACPVRRLGLARHESSAGASGDRDQPAALRSRPSAGPGPVVFRRVGGLPG